MKLKRYFFGYLFVRLAKLLACLALLGMAGALVRTTISFRLERSRVVYEKSGNLDRQFRHLEDELDFTTREISRIADVSRLQPVKIGTAGETISELEANDGGLARAVSRRDELKRLLTQTLEEKAGQLRDRIDRVKREIERVRAETAPKPTTTPSAPAPSEPPRRVFAPPSSGSSIPRTVFGEIDARQLGGMIDSIREAAGFFRDLSQRAEKEESRALINDVVKELDDLTSWLPPLPKPATPVDRRGAEPQPQSPSPSPNVTPEPAPDPLVTAERNYRTIGLAVENIKARLLRGWTLDAMLDQAQSTLEGERTRCRLADLALRRIWLNHATEAGIALGIGLATAFLILVFADFIQSLFDTATNTRAILGHLRDENDPGGTA